jgi:hypothetical protein
VCREVLALARRRALAPSRRQLAAGPLPAQAACSLLLCTHKHPKAVRHPVHPCAMAGACAYCSEALRSSYDRCYCVDCCSGPAATFCACGFCAEQRSSAVGAPAKVGGVSGVELVLRCTTGWGKAAPAPSINAQPDAGAAAAAAPLQAAGWWLAHDAPAPACRH